jgi:hypothetical protein
MRAIGATSPGPGPRDGQVWNHTVDRKFAISEMFEQQMRISNPDHAAIRQMSLARASLLRVHNRGTHPWSP